MHLSEVAQLRQQIEMECQAMLLGFRGYAAVARHEFISNKYKTLGQYMDQLESLLGPEEAERIACETYNAVIDQKAGTRERE
jgi:hypothetical protein